MFNILAQASYNYDYTTTSTSSAAGAGAVFAVLGFMFIIMIGIWVFMAIAMWKMFEKAGEQGWKALIPIYDTWILAELVGRPGYWGLFPLLGFIPFVGSILALIVSVILYIDTAKAFGKEPVWALLLIFVPFVGFPILGFGSAKYVGTRFVTNMSGTPPASSGPTPPVAPTA